MISLISIEIKVRTCSFGKKNKTSSYMISAGITCSKSTIEVLEQGMKYVKKRSLNIKVKKRDPRTTSLMSFCCLEP